MLGSRPRGAPGGAVSQAYDCGAGLCAAGTLRAVCRAWRRVHDSRVVSLRPRALDPLALPSAFPGLQRLDLSRVPFPPLPALAAALPRLRALTALTMRDNGAGHLAATTLASALRSSACRLTVLNLGENHVDDRGATALAAALHVNRSLTELNLRDNGVTDAGAAALASCLGVGCRLLTLDCSGNAAVGVDACVALAHALSAPAAPPPLATLSLGGCGVGDAGARVLGDALPRCVALRSLSLFSASIGDAGAAALAAGLSRNGGGLTALNLFGNRIGDAGAAAMAAALAANRALTALDVYDNEPIGAAGVRALAAVLQPGGGASAALRQLRLDLAPLPAEEATALAASAGQRLDTAGVRGRRH